MKYDELREMGRKMDKGEVDRNLASLAADPRFAAVVAWVERNRESWVDIVAQQGFASDHGKLAHAAGSLHALRVMAGQLKNVVEPPKAGPRRQPEEE